MKNTFRVAGRRILLTAVSSLAIAGLCYFHSFSFARGVPEVKLKPEAELQARDRCGVSDAQCVAYLESLGYTNVTVVNYQGCNSICDTSNPYNTKVLIESGIITGMEDLPQR